MKPTYYQWTRPEMADLLPPRYSRVLEIGCGAGAFRAHLGQDCEYWGIEPAPAAAAIAATKLDRVLVGTYDAVADQLPERYFDLVICNDVIEHMVDHDAFLSAIKAKLGDGANLVGSIPNVRYVRNLAGLVIQGDWHYQAIGGILDNTHLRFFTEKSLKRSLNQGQYDIELFRRVNPIWRRESAIKGLANLAMTWPIALLLGWDVMYVQFGFRVRHGVAAG